MKARRVLLASACLAAALLEATPVRAQGAPAYARESFHEHAHATTVAVGLRLHAGSQDDVPGREGTAWLLGRVLEAQAERALSWSGATVTVSVERATTLVTLLAIPGEWEEAWSKVDSVLFVAPLDGAEVEARRRELLDRLSFEAGSPVEVFQAEAAGLLAEPGSPYARPPRGTRQSVPAVTSADLAAYRSGHYRREAAVRSVVGPVPSGGIAPAVVPADTAAADTVGAEPAFSGALPGGVAWVTGDRVSEFQDVTSTWMTVAYPVPSALPRTHLELLAHLLREELDPTPPDPDRYSVVVRLEETPRGAVLLVEATVFPEATRRWEERITGAVRRLAENPIPDDFFRWRRRRFRTARLLEESSPELEAARATADLLRDGTVRDLGVEIWGLEGGAVQDAARSLGPPRVFLLGPDLGGGSGGTPPGGTS